MIKTLQHVKNHYLIPYSKQIKTTKINNETKNNKNLMLTIHYICMYMGINTSIEN